MTLQNVSSVICGLKSVHHPSGQCHEFSSTFMQKQQHYFVIFLLVVISRRGGFVVCVCKAQLKVALEKPGIEPVNLVYNA